MVSQEVLQRLLTLHEQRQELLAVEAAGRCDPTLPRQIARVETEIANELSGGSAAVTGNHDADADADADADGM